MKQFFDFSNIKGDLFGGITAGIVALPLALAFGEQSGLGAGAGLYGAAFIAFFAALFGGTNTQISGPTAPMTAMSMVVIAGLIQTFEGNRDMAIPIILAVFLLAGLIQMGMGFIKLGTFIKFIPYPVVSGFMTGIGVIILITQIAPAVGYYSGEDQNLVDSFKPQAEELILERILKQEADEGFMVLENFQETIDRASEVGEEHIHEEAFILAQNDGKGVIGSVRHFLDAVMGIKWLELLLCLATILIIYGFKRIVRPIPSTLIALVVVSGVAVFVGWNFVQIQDIPAGLPVFHLGIFTRMDLGALAPFFQSAVLLALLGSIDSLLTSVVADNLTKTQHKPNRELIGQGIGNSIAAMFGGLPGAGATIRTVVNIHAGGKTRLSGMISGVLLFVIMIALGPIASQIPAAVLAGILITVGIGVMDYRGLKALRKMDRSERIILLTVLILTVFWQLVGAVVVGLVMAALVFLSRMSGVSAKEVKVRSLKLTHEDEPLWGDEIDIAEDIRDKVIFKHMSGPMFFGIVSEFRTLVSELPDIHMLIIRMQRVPFIDQSGVYALQEAIEELKNQDVLVVICGANTEVEKSLRCLELIPDVVPERHVFKEFVDCREWMVDVLHREDGIDQELREIRSLSHFED